MLTGEFALLQYGATPVPWTVAWSAEVDAPHWLAREAQTGREAVFTIEQRGVGVPRFARPHDQRLRRAMLEQRCDLCGLPLRGVSRVSLSIEQATDVGWAQTEPLLHRACGIISLGHCPRLQERARKGILPVRQVTDLDITASFLTADAVREITGEDRPDGAVVGAFKYIIRRWVDRDLQWLLKEVK